MDFKENIFKRMELKKLCTFLLEGLDDSIVESDTYENRLKNGSNSIYKRLENICQNEDELDKAISDLSEVLVAYESVYTEIGMKFGARIIFQLLHRDDFAGFDGAEPK